MSTKAVQNKFSNNIDKNTQYLIFGYVREIGIKNQLIPSTVIALCTKFYISKSRIFYIKKTGYNAEMVINIADLDERKYYNCNLIKLSSANKLGYATNMGLCIVHNIKLPSFISSYNELQHIRSFDVLFILGLDAQRKSCYAYIMNSHFNGYNHKTINLYQYALPSLY